MTLKLAVLAVLAVMLTAELVRETAVRGTVGGHQLGFPDYSGSCVTEEMREDVIELIN